MANCACGATTNLRAILIHDLSSLPNSQIVAIALCAACIEKHGLYCTEHRAPKICFAGQPGRVYTAHPETLSRACPRCVLTAVTQMDREEKSRIVSCLDVRMNGDIVSAYIPKGDRGLFTKLDPTDRTIFGLAFSAELDNSTIGEMAAMVASMQRGVHTNVN